MVVPVYLTRVLCQGTMRSTRSLPTQAGPWCSCLVMLGLVSRMVAWRPGDAAKDRAAHLEMEQIPMGLELDCREQELQPQQRVQWCSVVAITENKHCGKW